jgi:hypothetical protein
MGVQDHHLRLLLRPTVAELLSEGEHERMPKK